VIKVKLNPNLLSEEAQKLKEFLSSRLVNQDRAIKKVVEAYELFLSPLRNPYRPIITMLACGPSGVGKTYLAELLAEFFFDNRSALTKIECVSYTERHEIARLIGAPPGYVGYSTPPLLDQNLIDRFDLDKKMKEFLLKGRLSKKTIEQSAKKNTGDKKKAKNTKAEIDELLLQEFFKSIGPNYEPIAVILFDEIEKAHPTLMNLLLEIADKGYLTMADSSVTVFNSSFIILTSNIGSNQIAKAVKGVTFGFQTDAVDRGNLVYTEAINKIRKILPPELLGRLKKDIVIFRPLSKDDYWQILNNLVDEFRLKIEKDINFRLVVAEKVKEMIFEESLDHQEFGARLIKDKIRSYLEVPLARMINSGQVVIRSCVKVELRRGKLEFVMKSDQKRLEKRERGI